MAKLADNQLAVDAEVDDAIIRGRAEHGEEGTDVPIFEADHSYCCNQFVKCANLTNLQRRGCEFVKLTWTGARVAGSRLPRHTRVRALSRS